MNKEILFLQTTWSSLGSDSVNIDIELKSNNDFNFSFYARFLPDDTTEATLKIELYATPGTGQYSLVAEATGTADSSMVTLDKQNIAKGKYRIIISNSVATAGNVYYRYQFTQT